MSIELTADQKAAVEACVSNRCIFITGPAGTGKSVLIRHLVSETFQQVKVHLCSSTGISAYNIKGTTVHSFMLRIGLADNHPMKIELGQEDVIIIDEISMLGRKTFEDLSDSLQRYHKVTGVPFGGHHMILVGDFAQLPPVDDSFCFQSKYWSYVDETIELKEIKRQNNREFVEFLLRIRSGELSMADRKRLVGLSKKRVIGESIHLYPTNDRAREHNELKLSRVSEESKNPIVSFESVVDHHGTDVADEESFFSAHKARIYKTLSVCVGSRVMLTQNMNIKEGWINGAIGIVKSVDEKGIQICREEDGREAHITRESYARQKIVRCSKCKSMCHKEGHESYYHASYFDVMPEEVDKRYDYMTVMQYPLLLAWGMTVHKSQGLTLSSCVIHLYGRYTPSIFYVAISRCVSEDGVVLRSGEGIRFDQIVPEEMVMREIFGKKERECQVCKDEFVGPYKLCQDCCSSPSPYEIYPFTSFEKKLTKDKEDYVFQVLERPSSDARDVRSKKFLSYIKSVYKVFKQ